MNFRNTAIAVVVLALLLGFLYYDQQQQAAAPTPTAAPLTKVLDVNPDDVSGLQVSSAVSLTVTHKDNGAWYIDAPNKEAVLIRCVFSGRKKSTKNRISRGTHFGADCRYEKNDEDKYR